MCGDEWIFVLALFFTSASSNDERQPEASCGQCSDLCEAHAVSAPLGSSVLLPCNFTAADLGNVSWAHGAAENLLTLTPQGHVRFLLPKKGRVKVFPNQGSKGNYSIRIDELQQSDLGCYCCRQGEACHQVDLRVRADTLSEDMWHLIYFCVIVGTFILFVVSCYLIFRKRKQNSATLLINADTEGASDPPSLTGPAPQHEEPIGADDYVIYDNDDQCYCGPVDLPYLTSDQPTQRLERQRTIRRFQREVFDTSGHTPITQLYYANQEEIRNQHATSAASGNHQRGARKKKKKKGQESQEYKNPIYGRGADQLHL